MRAVHPVPTGVVGSDDSFEPPGGIPNLTGTVVPGADGVGHLSLLILDGPHVLCVGALHPGEGNTHH